MGDEAERQLAFERFTGARLDRAYRLAGMLLRDRMEAEDAVHDAAVSAWLHWANLREPDRLDAWFDRIVVNECRARLRSRRVRPLGMTEPSPSTRDAATAVADRDLLVRTLARLDADHRIVVVLRHVFDLSTAEIAARTGAREGTVKSRLHYALREMRAAIEASERASGDPRP